MVLNVANVIQTFFSQFCSVKKAHMAAASHRRVTTHVNIRLHC